MEFKGTKTKWELRNNLVDITAEDKGLIITCYTKGSIFGTITKEEAQANALLISKAPEMLEMLKDIIFTWNNNGNFDNEYFSNIQKLIKEATEL